MNMIRKKGGKKGLFKKGMDVIRPVVGKKIKDETKCKREEE